MYELVTISLGKVYSGLKKEKELGMAQHTIKNSLASMEVLLNALDPRWDAVLSNELTTCIHKPHRCLVDPQRVQSE